MAIWPPPMLPSVPPILQNVNLLQYLTVACGPLNPIDIEIIVGGAVIDPRDVSDRAARLLGKIYGDQGVLTQRAATLDLQVQLRTAGTEYDAREITKWIGSVAPTIGQKTMANSLPVVIASDQVTFPVTVTFPATYDVSDRAARLVGVIDSLTKWGGTALTGRDISLDLAKLQPPSSIGTIADVTAAAALTQIIVASTPCVSVLVRSLAANAASIRVGDSNVLATRGAEISPGDSIAIAIDNVNKLYVFGNGTDKVSITYVT